MINVDLVFTDPPYGISIVGDNGKVGAGKLAKNRIYSKVISDDTTETARKSYEILKTLSNKLIIWGGITSPIFWISVMAG